MSAEFQKYLHDQIDDQSESLRDAVLYLYFNFDKEGKTCDTNSLKFTSIAHLEHQCIEMGLFTYDNPTQIYLTPIARKFAEKMEKELMPAEIASIKDG